MRDFVNVYDLMMKMYFGRKGWFKILQIYFAMHFRLRDISGTCILFGDHMNISLFFSNSHGLNSLKQDS